MRVIMISIMKILMVMMISSNLSFNKQKERIEINDLSIQLLSILLISIIKCVLIRRPSQSHSMAKYPAYGSPERHRERRRGVWSVYSSIRRTCLLMQG